MSADVPVPTPPEIEAAMLSAAHRKQVTLLLVLCNFLIVAIVAIRDQDIGPNAGALLTWLVVGNVVGIVGGMGSDVLKAFVALRAPMSERLAPK